MIKTEVNQKSIIKLWFELKRLVNKTQTINIYGGINLELDDTTILKVTRWENLDYICLHTNKGKIEIFPQDITKIIYDDEDTLSKIIIVSEDYQLNIHK